jgi:hypothetical protein
MLTGIMEERGKVGRKEGKRQDRRKKGKEEETKGQERRDVERKKSWQRGRKREREVGK